MVRPVTIRRRKKHEAEQAIKDLQARGYEIVHPLTELHWEGKQFSRDMKGNAVFVQNTSSSCWFAQMKRRG